MNSQFDQRPQPNEYGYSLAQPYPPLTREEEAIKALAEQLRRIERKLDILIDRGPHFELYNNRP